MDRRVIYVTKIFVRLLDASGCLPVASGPQNGFAKKNPNKYVYYLHMGPPYGFLWFFDVSKLFNFHSLLLFAFTFSLIFQVSPNLLFRFSEIMLPAQVGSTILEIGTQQLGP